MFFDQCDINMIFDFCWLRKGATPTNMEFFFRKNNNIASYREKKQPRIETKLGKELRMELKNKFC